MTKIIIGKASNHNVSLDLNILLTTRALLTADSGGGKTFALKRIIEQAFGKIQILVLDPEGEFSPLREKFDFVLVGKNGETPADVRSAALVAQTLLKLRACAICDLYEMKPSERHAWVRKFLDALIESPKEYRHPCLVIVDEAHIFAPEHGKGESEASDAMIGLCTRGRKRLLVPLFATQRLATLSKDASSMLLNRMIGATFEDVNRKRAADVLSINKEDQKEFYKQIQTLEPGNFFCLGRAISKERILVHIGPIKTAHGQEALKYEIEPPPAPEAIAKLLPKLADLPKQAEEKAKTEAELRTEIRSLKAQLRTQPTVAKEVKVVDQKAIEQAIGKERRKFALVLQHCRKNLPILEQAYKQRGELAEYLDAQGDALLKMEATRDQQPVQRTVPSHQSHRAEIRPPAPQYDEARRPAQVENNGTKLRAGAERMLAALATWHPGGMRYGQLRSHAGLKKSGTYSSYMSDLRSGGYIEERGDEVFATQSGLDYCQHVPAAPQTTQEVLDIWNPKLRDGARRMLAILVEAGEPLTKEDLGERAGLKKSGTYSSYISDLRTARLIVTHREGTVSADKETLFL
jgi:hypothetical protein